MTAGRRVAYLVGTSFTALVLFVSCSDSPTPKPAAGNALQALNQTNLDSRAMGVGEEFVFLATPLINETTDEIVIKEVRPLVEAGEDVIEVLDYVLVPVDLDSPRTRMQEGEYQTYPPTVWAGGRCRTAELHDPEGYVLTKGADVLLGMHYRTIATGEFSVTGHEVIYEVGGKEAAQVFAVGKSGKVVVDAPPNTLSQEARCADDSNMLPGFDPPS